MKDEQLLLAEYQHFSEAFLRNEELGERRVNFFITLTTAVIAGIITLYTSEVGKMDVEVIEKIALLALLGNLIFGLVTFVKILWRNKVTKEYKSIIKDLREMLKIRSESLQRYKPKFNPNKWWLTGGLSEMVAVMNCIILTIIVGIKCPFAWASITTFVLTFFVQFFFIKQSD